MLRFPVYSSTISYPLPAWEGTEGVTYSPWAQGLAAEKSILVCCTHYLFQQGAEIQYS